MSLDLEFASADVFGLTPLAARALTGRTEPLALHVPQSAATVPRPDTTLFDPPRRAELAEHLEVQLTARGAHVAVLESVRALRVAGATCVIAGQQPGLFGGPLFNTFKALHVVRLARTLALEWGTPVVPVLWNHADDHDIAEVHHAWFVNDQHNLVKVGLPGASSGRTPCSHYSCSEERHQLAALRSRVRDLCAAGIDPDLIAQAVPRDGETLAAAWTRFHLEHFGHLGLVVLEPDWIRNSLSEALADIVAPHPLAALDAGSERLHAAGLDVAIDPKSAALVYHLTGNLGDPPTSPPPERHALRPGGDGWTFDHEEGSRTPSELAAEIVQDKAAYNAGALLRPIVQDLALPTAAYVGGLGELAYHAQLGELRTAVGLQPGVFVPRLSASPTDARLRTSLRHIKRTAAEFLAAPQHDSAPAQTLPPGQAERLDTAFQTYRELLMAEHDPLGALDPGLAGQLRRVLSQSKKHLAALSERVRRIQASSSGSDRRHRRRLAAWMWPREAPPERILTTSQVLSMWGTDWIDELLDQLEPFPIEHHIAHIDPHG